MALWGDGVDEHLATRRAARREGFQGRADPGRFRRAVLALSTAFLALFGGFNAAQGMQTTLNGTWGNINLAVLYTTFTLCCIPAPGLVSAMEARGLPGRLALVVPGVAYVCMVLVNLLPVPPADDPSFAGRAAANVLCNFAVGLGAGVLWTTQNMYVGRNAICAARLSPPGEGGSTAGEMACAFNGLFFMIYQFAGAFGTGASTVVVDLDQADNSRTTLFLVLGAFSALGTLGFLAIPPMPSAADCGVQRNPEEDGCRQCSRTLRLLISDRRMALTAPLIFANGCFLAFAFGEYPKRVTATLGPDYSAPAVLAFYACNAGASWAWGALLAAKRIAIASAFWIATGLQVGVFLLLIGADLNLLPLFREHYRENAHEKDIRKRWQLDPGGPPAWWEYLAPLLCICLAAVGDAVYESQLPALLQGCFQDERMAPAMANLKLWQSLGFAVQFATLAMVQSGLVPLVCLTGLFVVAFAAFAVALRPAPAASPRGPGPACGGSPGLEEQPGILGS